MMNEDEFNMEIRKFLKKVGITSQREVTNAVNKAVEEGKLSGTETLPIMAKLEIPGLEFEIEIGGTIALE